MTQKNTKTAPDLPGARSNRPITFMHRIEHGAACALLGFFRLIGVDAASWLSGKGLRVVGPVLHKIHQRGDDNLQRIYPDWSGSARRSVLADVWENLGRVGGEFAHLDAFQPTWDEAQMQHQVARLSEQNLLNETERARLSHYKPAENARIALSASDDFLIALAKKQPAIFVTGHFANWEIMGRVCAYVDVPCAIIYRAANNSLIDELIIKRRGQSSGHWQIPKGPEGARSFIDALKQDYSLGLLVDQKFTSGPMLPFTGIDAPTAPAPARMSLNYNMPLIPVVVERTKGAHFKMIAGDAITIERSGDMSADINALTGQINAVLGQKIDENPSQWLWFHRRWGKSLPSS